MKTQVWLLVCIICCFLMSGCTLKSLGEQNQGTDIPQEQDTLQLAPDFSYVVTEQLPNIRIDKVGYLPESKKTVFFLGEDIAHEFSILDQQSGDVIYEGNMVKAGTDQTTGKTIYSGDFTSLTEPGEYVIYQQALGYSYPFNVNENVYYNISTYLRSNVKKCAFTSVDGLTYTLANLMLTSEIYPNSQSDKLYLKRQIETLLTCQDEKTGAFSLNFPDTSEDKQISLTATTQAAGLLAQYCYSFAQDDVALRAKCIQAAGKAYQYISKYRDNIHTDVWYYAATQLYRATGGYQYRTAILEYDAMSDDKRSTSDYDYTLLADMAYLSTTYRTDFNRCTTIMNGYMEQAQAISLNSSRETYYVYPDIDTLSEKQLLRDMMVLGVVNYVLSGREYSGIQENYIHYFFGVNNQLKNRLTQEYLNDFNEDPLEENITKVSEFIFILGKLSSK